ncbi:hypothetical protein DFH09DRAFT_1373446 [Mycena vulgaris]|nr:hypothetical protein DFH09DRAFT_1373446 [Mycena vulgaris]
MDDGPHVEAEFRSESSMDGDGHRDDQYTAAFFPKAQHLVVAGGKFKSIINITQAAPMAPPDFHMIPMGDLDLREEIRPRHRSGVVYPREGRASVRRVYSARVHGSKSKMTVAVYQGENAEEVCCRCFSVQNFFTLVRRDGGMIFRDIHGFAIPISCNRLLPRLRPVYML